MALAGGEIDCQNGNTLYKKLTEKDKEWFNHDQGVNSRVACEPRKLDTSALTTPSKQVKKQARR
eukprot:5732812-Pyramimonas_sp.AAC.1